MLLDVVHNVVVHTAMEDRLHFHYTVIADGFLDDRCPMMENEEGKE